MSSVRPSNGFWAGLVVGILIVTALMYFHVDINHEDSASVDAIPHLTTDASADAFVGAWLRMTEGTWAVDSTFIRVTSGQANYSSAVRNVQLPPNYLNEASSAISASIDGQMYTCASVDNGVVAGCRNFGASPPYETYAQDRVAAVRSQVGEAKAYGVQQLTNNCFQLSLNLGRQAINWGNKARFCFDSATGAISSSVIEAEGHTDTTRSDKIAVATRADLQLSVLGQPTTATP